MLQFLLSGSALGLGAGLSPGPLLALVIAQTLRYRLREGLKVAVAPLFSDVPIVTLCLFVISELSSLNQALAVVSILGGLFVAYLGYESLRARAFEWKASETAPRSFPKAVLVNLLNPSVYVFWATVGSPMILRGLETSVWRVVAFVGSFYACLLGSKAVVAVMVSRSRGLLKGTAYRRTIQGMGVVLLGLAACLILDGLRLFLGERGM